MGVARGGPVALHFILMSVRCGGCVLFDVVVWMSLYAFSYGASKIVGDVSMTMDETATT